MGILIRIDMKTGYFLGLSEEGFHRIAYSEWGNSGENNKYPLICVHGLTRNRRDFDGLARYLSERKWQIFCPDVVGRGDSDWLKNSLHYTFEQYLSDANAMIDKTQASAIDWLGTSMGGIIGMILAALPNTPIHRLILNDVGPQVQLNGLTRLALYASQHPYFKNMQEAKEYHQRIFSDLGTLSAADWQQITENSVYEVQPGVLTLKFDPGIKTTSLKSKIAWKSLLHPHKALEGVLFDIELWDIWQAIKCPVLVIHGKNSDILSTDTVRRMQATHAKVDVVEIADAGHAPALLDAGQQQMIYAWLNE